MPTRIDRATYGTVAIDGTLSFTNFVREDEYSEDKEVWKQEVGSVGKQWNKFNNDGKAICFAVKG